MSTAIAPVTPLSRTTWAKVDVGFHVGSRSGTFVGTIDETADGSFVAFDARSTAVGRYESLKEARRAVDQVARRSRTGARPSRTAHMAQSVATVSGLVAVGLLATAAAMPFS